jgi:hypothetical protein
MSCLTGGRIPPPAGGSGGDSTIFQFVNLVERSMVLYVEALSKLKF